MQWFQFYYHQNYYNLLTIEARIQSPRLFAVIRSVVQRLALLDSGSQKGLVLAMWYTDFNQTIYVDSFSGHDETTLVNGALCKAFQIVRCINRWLVFGHSQLGNLLRGDVVGGGTFLCDLGDQRLGVLRNANNISSYSVSYRRKNQLDLPGRQRRPQQQPKGRQPMSALWLQCN